MTNDHRIFNRLRLRQHRDRAATQFSEHDFLLREMAERLSDRLEDVTRTFPLALDLGAHNSLLAQVLGGRGGIEKLIQSDLSHKLMYHSRESGNPSVICDEEFLPFAEDSFDLVMSCGSLHWVNDLPGTLIQIRRILKPDGLFLAMLPGGQTLMELREAFEQAEMHITGGISPRVSPFIDVRDSGSLLQRAGFALPVVDSDSLTVRYEHPLKLLHDLRGMGQTNVLMQSAKQSLRRDVLVKMIEEYQARFSGEDGRVAASFELVTLTAWKPHPSQQQPLKRGSGQVSLGDVLS